ncbi:MAG: hypothetical protein ACI9OO_000242 [Bacteroidia bacterium]|jgi:hypothetical protein
MEKIIYALWKTEADSGDQFRDKLRNELCPALIRDGIHKIRICVSDSGVAAAQGYRMESSKSAANAIVSVWVDTAISRKPIEAELQKYTGKFAGYLVTESEPLVNQKHTPGKGERTFGMNQVVFLQKPERLTFAEWIDIWHGSHTQIAIDTQSTFGYRQNVVARALTKGAPACDAIVEENFPEAAIHGRAAFYNADGNPELQQERELQMMGSCMRFIDFDKIDCVPMSEYVIS